MKYWRRINWALATVAVMVAASDLAAGIWMQYMASRARLVAIPMGMLGAGAGFVLALASAHIVAGPGRDQASLGCMIGAGLFLPVFMLNSIAVLSVMSWLGVAGLWPYHGGQLVVPAALLFTAIIVKPKGGNGPNQPPDCTW